MPLEHAIIETAQTLLNVIEQGEGEELAGVKSLAIALDEFALEATRVGYRGASNDHAAPREEYKVVRSQLDPLWPSLEMYPLASQSLEDFLDGDTSAALGWAKDDLADSTSELREGLSVAKHSTEQAAQLLSHSYLIHSGEHIHTLRLYIHRLLD